MGGVYIGVRPDGSLIRGLDYGHLNIDKTSSGMLINGNIIDDYPRICEFAQKLHMRVPLCALIGWDIALDKNNNPILIECNTKYPGTLFPQMLNGPIFGERFDEVIDFVFGEGKVSH